ncbi:suppressor protein SRP40-like [Abrus precatorius]|uniref:Suppressor protein SRP40-like n=1 Tax=Abrus precatorius TaxID=3816 RepID=A0A8B8K301_ABRPR|nr:suppressor protein SRP40-like [Abrus precatorius]
MLDESSRGFLENARNSIEDLNEAISFFCKCRPEISSFEFEPLLYCTHAFHSWWSNYYNHHEISVEACNQKMTSAFSMFQKGDPKAKTRGSSSTTLKKGSSSTSQAASGVFKAKAIPKTKTPTKPHISIEMAASTPVQQTPNQPSALSVEVSTDDTQSVNSPPKVRKGPKKRLTPIPEESKKISRKEPAATSQQGNEAASSSSSGSSSSSSDTSSSSSSSSSEDQAQTEPAPEVPPISQQTSPLGSPEVDVVTYQSEEEGPLHEVEENVAEEGNQVPENPQISVEGPPNIGVVPPASSINSEMNLDDFNAMVEEDPEGAIDKILASTFTFSSSSHTPSGSHSEVSKPTESTEKMLEELRSLVFDAPMMKNLPTDKDLVAKIKGLLSSFKAQLSTFPEGLQRFESLFIDSLAIIDQTAVVGSKQDQARAM